MSKVTEPTETKEKVEATPPEPKKLDGSSYSCEVLLQRTTLEAANDKSFPTDARLVHYEVEGQSFIDLTRSQKTVNIFDLYCDTYGKTAVKKIDFGFGTTSPARWGYKTPPKKRKRR
tara:strand:- start:566 stop:916 length:351 start_codon:yes stop_codon:yes gene_type:complete